MYLAALFTRYHMVIREVANITWEAKVGSRFCGTTNIEGKTQKYRIVLGHQIRNSICRPALRLLPGDFPEQLTVVDTAEVSLGPGRRRRG